MMEVGAAACVALLVAMVFVRGYTTKMLTQLRRDCGMLIHEEKRLRADCDQTEILQESADARRSQAQMDVENYRRELEDLIPAIAKIEAELDKARADEES
ncbi:MAG: hypothetical protein HOC05_16955 [Gemmatimonadetes bacterium]|jgi:Sec-independent protein translocase protein TatA|nr:hypothetical protein [Gemmatimonadota bacterium]MBT5592008.1 hypothetical protein [Gemmatimonadota bacterium]MBT6629587.1 hypothetical protein [Gemmatimonadota bacterium]MBT7453292.1 hypothetical protein [Gemmatimonadota bacterium]MBT7595465.1 hypothetical protein [Gemmatimonadota bacterium]